jgi:hypothetical protein
MEATSEEPYRGTEARIDIHPPRWLAMAARSGLALREHRGDLCGQEVYVFESRAA